MSAQFPKRARPTLGTLIAFTAAYICLDWVSYIHPLQQSSITPWNPHPALILALLAIYGQRYFGAAFLAILGAEVAVRHMPGGVASTVVVSLVLTLGYAAVATALTAVVAIPVAHSSLRDLVRLVIVIAIGTLLTGTLYVGALWATGTRFEQPYFEALVQFWIGDFVGVLVTLPIVLLLQDPRKRQEILAVLRGRVFWLQVACTFAALWLVFGPVFAQPFKFFYVLFLPLIWTAVTFGLLGAAHLLALIQLAIILAAQLTSYSSLTVFELQSLLIALAVTGLLLGITVDDRRRAAERLRESLRLAAAGEMSAALAHELHQPLAALETYAQSSILISSREPLDRALLNDSLAKMLGEASRAAKVVHRLRDFFRTGATDLHSCSLGDIVGEVVEAHKSNAGELGVKLAYSAIGQMQPILLDPTQMSVVIRNLIANAVEAATRGGQGKWVSVEVAHGPPGYLQVTVRDSGAGVSSEQCEAVFEPFTSSRPQGMGMGLSISRAIVEGHGGRLWTEPAGLGFFAFTLPLANA